MNFRTNMRYQSLPALLLLVVLAAGCDTGAPLDPNNLDGPDQAGFTGLLPPSLSSIDASEPVKAGDVITIIGVNLDPVLDNNQVLFTCGNGQTAGLPLNLRQEPSPSNPDNLISELEVVVPGGASTGQVVLSVNGVDVGATSLDAVPQLIGFTLGLDSGTPLLEYVPRLGFDEGASRVTVFGYNFAAVQEAILSDSLGNIRRVPANTFVRDPIQTTLDQEPSGISSIAFDLRDDANDVRLPFDGDRANMRILLRGEDDSNALEIPVTANTEEIPEIGFVISSVKVPTGVVTGPVRIEYTCYELAVASEWNLRVDFRVKNTSFESDWLPATPIPRFDPSDLSDDDFQDEATRRMLSFFETHPNNGTANILPGHFLHRSNERLLPGIGDRRAFIWDAVNDPLFRAINEQSENSLPRPRWWRMEFRLRPEADTANRFGVDVGHEVISPLGLYYDLRDRDGDNRLLQRRVVLSETFDDTEMEEDARNRAELLSVLHQDIDLSEDDLENLVVNTAIWGPPINPGLLAGNTDVVTLQSGEVFNEFGQGDAIVILKPVEPSFLDPGETILDEWIEFETERCEVIHHVISDNGTPDPADDVDTGFIELFGNESGELTSNPGCPEHEFHFARMAVCSLIRIESSGRYPLVIRLSGQGSWPSAAHPDHPLGADEINNACPLVDADNPELPLSDEIVFHTDATSLMDFGGDDGSDGSPVCPCPTNCGHVLGGGGAGAAGGGNGGTGGGLWVNPGTNRITDFWEAEDGGRYGGGRGGTPAAINFEQNVVSNFAGAPGGGGGHRLVGGRGDYGRKNVPQYQAPEIGEGGPIRGDWSQAIITGGSGGGGGGGSYTSGHTAAGGGGGGGGGAFKVVVEGRVDINGQISANGGAGAQGAIPHIHVPFCPDYPHSPQMAPGGAAGGGSGGSITIQATGDIGLDDCTQLSVLGGDGGNTPRAGNQRGGDGAPGYIRLESAGRGLPFCDQVDLEGLEIDSVGVVEVPAAEVGGRGQDGVLHVRFIPSIDEITGLPRLDALGNQVSLWFYDTDSGDLTRPDGSVFESRTPGVLDLTRLRVDENVTLRVFGSRALRIHVRETAEIAGTIDVSGFDGGMLRFSAPGLIPLSGLGGESGPGGGAGAEGGFIEFANGDPFDKSLLNVVAVPGDAGGVPEGTEALFSEDGAVDQPIPLGFVRATGGSSIRLDPCTPACRDANSAGGGAGGGNSDRGEGGDARSQAGDEAELSGVGAGAFGFDTLRQGGELFLFGGTGGSGGGASPFNSSAYADGAISGRFQFPAAALTAPGTGGGGGGGALLLVADVLILRPTAEILARGGDAFQSIDNGGNGGAGAGGTVVIQVLSSLQSDDGAVIDVNGGIANRAPGIVASGEDDFGNAEFLTAYEGNIRNSARDSRAEDFRTDLEVFGGLGGNGAPGRVSIETPEGSGLAVAGENEDLSTGRFLTDVVESISVSKPVRLGLGPAFAVNSFRLALGAPRIVFSPLQPAGTETVILWEGARDSADILCDVGDLRQLVRDPRDLRHHEFVRYVVVFRSSLVTRNSLAIRDIELPYTIEPLILDR